MSTRLRFTPQLVPSALVSAVLVLLVGLGFWQLDRAAQKRRLFGEYAERAQDEAVVLGDDSGDIEALRFRRVQVPGSFDDARQLLLDNRLHEGVAGYHVVTPFRIDDGPGVVLVNRGWVALGSDRSQLPEVSLTPGRRTLTALVSHFPQPALKLGTADAGAVGWPRVIQYYDLPALEQAIGSPLLPYLLLLDPEEADGFVRQWAPPVLGAERHTAYAVQWFALAAVLLILFLLANVKRTGGQPDAR